MPTSSDKPATDTSLVALGKAEVERVAREQADDAEREKYVQVQGSPDCIEVEAGIETDRATWSAWCRYYWDKAKGWVAGGRVEW